MTPETKSTINFGPIKGGLEFSGSTFSGRKLHLKIATPYMVHHGALRLKNIKCKKKRRKTNYDWLSRVCIIVRKLGSALSELSECPNRAECQEWGRICPTVRACPTELSNVRMSTPGEITFTSPTSP